MQINCTSADNGIKINHNGKDFRLIYPKGMWGAYPSSIKDVLVDNLAHLLTIDLPLVADLGGLSYNTSMPIFHEKFKEVVINTIPSSVESYAEDTEDILTKFKNIVYSFSDNQEKVPDYTQSIDNRVIVPLSFGKDSLLTFAVCGELGLDPVPVYINDTVSPAENSIKLEHGRQFSNEFIPLDFVTNEIEKINDFEYWNKDETCLSYMHMVTGFCFIALPIVNRYNAKYIVLGNQYDMNFSFVNKNGFTTYPSPDQTIGWTKQMNKMIRQMTKNTGVTSVISPLTNIAIMKILHHRYPQYAKYNVSCDCLNASDEKRWCHECSKCARLFLFMKAVGADVSKVGFTRNMLDSKNKNLFSLFNGSEIDNYEKSKEARDQQLLAFYMLVKNRESGGLIDEFKSRFLDEAESREEELHRQFFSIHEPELLPADIRPVVVSIYKEELG